MRYGMHYIQGSVDCHVHACPHLNGRSVDVFQAVREASATGMRAVVLMDNFQNSSGLAALAMRELGDLGVEVFGGLVMQPTAGGVSVDAARTALGYGYEPGDGARFISLPTHHTRHVAMSEGRGGAYLDSAFHVPEGGPVPDDVLEIMDLCAEHNAVFDCGHVSGAEAVILCDTARSRGLTRLRTHAGRYTPDEIAAITATGAYAEFSFFMLSHATQVGLTHADAEKHRIEGDTIQSVAPRIQAAGARAIASSDAGVFLLAPPVEAFREFMLLLESAGFTETEIRRMNTTNPAALFGIDV